MSTTPPGTLKPEPRPLRRFFSADSDLVANFRRNANFLLMGRFSEKLFDALWFLVGILANVVIMAPPFLFTALIFGYLHFEVIGHPGRAVLVTTVFLQIAWWIVVVAKRLKNSMSRAKLTLPHWIGWLVVHLFCSLCLVLASFSVEFIRDQLRWNQLSLFSTAGTTVGLFGALSAIRSYVPARLAKSQSVVAMLIAIATFLILFFCYVLAVNWIVYGNAVEIGYWVNRIPEKYQIALVALIVAAALACFLWMLSYRDQSGFSVDCLGYAVPPIVALILLMIYWGMYAKPIREQMGRILFSVGTLSRPLRVYTAFDPEKANLQDSTKSFLKRLSDQRHSLRNNQEFRESEEHGLENIDNYSNVVNYGHAQSYVDNVVELCSISKSEKFEIRQAIARLSRERLFQRALMQTDGIQGSMTDYRRWSVAKPVLIYLAQERILKKQVAEGSAIDTKVLIPQLSNIRVSSLYQKEFQDLFVTGPHRVPEPFSETSAYPGTMPLFFDGLTDKELKSSIERYPTLQDFSGTQKTTGTSPTIQDLVKSVRPAPPSPIKQTQSLSLPLFTIDFDDIKRNTRYSRVELAEAKFDFPEYAKQLIQDLIRNDVEEDSAKAGDGNRSDSAKEVGGDSRVEPESDGKHIEAANNESSESCSASNPLSNGSEDDSNVSDNPRKVHKVRFVKREDTQAKSERSQANIEGDRARRQIIFRALWMGDALEFINEIQSPKFDFGDAKEKQIASYQAKGRESFTSEELIYIAVAPFASDTTDSEVNQRLDYVASTIAFSDYADFEKTAQLRIELFKQTFHFKGQFVLFLIAVLGLAAVAIDVNWTSANGYYRGKIANSFLAHPKHGNLDRKVSELANPSTLPYLLINCVVNLQGSENLSLRERQSDSFLISPMFVGCSLIGYCPTKRLEAADRSFKLSTAVAISAAAVSPNMGKYTNRFLVWILSLMNFRLGYWIPNVREIVPREADTSVEQPQQEFFHKADDIAQIELRDYVNRRRAVSNWAVDTQTQKLAGLAFPGGGIRAATFCLGVCQALEKAGLIHMFDYFSTVSGGGYIGAAIVSSCVSSENQISYTPSIGSSPNSPSAWRPLPTLLIREMLSDLRESSAWLNLSDGGHIENLAVYELLQRRCKLIVVCNPEADRENPNNGLGMLLRLAEVSLGIKIDIDVDPMEPSKRTKLSKKHWTIGTITYPGDVENQPSGRIIMLRLSLTGDESTAITEYAERSKLFPFEPTTDQFFSESQFEAYRLLGEHIGEDFVQKVIGQSLPTHPEEFYDQIIQSMGQASDS